MLAICLLLDMEPNQNIQSSVISSISRTPNPSTYKITLAYKWLPYEMWECTSAQGASESWLAEKIWALGGISKVFLYEDMVVITKSSHQEWDCVISGVILAIEKHFMSQKPVLKNSLTESGHNTEEEELICEVIRDYIQPAVAADGGFIRFHKFIEGIVYISMHGACSGCPSSEITLTNGIERILKFRVPGVSSVVIAEGV